MLEHRSGPDVLDFCNAENVADLVHRGATPEHVIHIKRFGVALPAPVAGDMAGWADKVRAAVATYKDEYRAYFERNNARVGGIKRMLDPMPRVFYVAGVGLFAAGPTKKAARVGADVAEATIAVIRNAEGIESFEALSEEDLFDIEYWSLEQVKLTKQAEKPLSRQVAVITGGAGGLGLAIAEALHAEGAEIALLDLAEDALQKEAARLGGVGLVCDVTKPEAVDAALADVARHFGGIDIVIERRCGLPGRPARCFEEVFPEGFRAELLGAPLYCPQRGPDHESPENWRCTGLQCLEAGGQSRPRLRPLRHVEGGVDGTDAQYAVEHGADGITSNAVNADRIRTGLMTDQMIEERSQARGISPESYMRGNLVRREVTAQDVAAAFVHLAKARTSTGAVLTVDGGNVGAMMR